MHDQSVLSFGGDNKQKAPNFEDGRQAQKTLKKLTTQVVPFSNLNHREILQELLSWEVVYETESESSENNAESDDADTTADDPANDPSHLLHKFDKYMQEKEDQNQAMYDKIKRVKEKSYKNKKQAQAALDKCETPDPSLPPFPEVESEPFGDSSSFKFNDDAVFEKLNEFANSTYQMGESLLRKITLPDFFSRSSSSDSDTQNTQQSKRDD